MGLAGRAWVARLPAELARQRAILDGLLDLCEADDHITWLIIGCSVARGAGDGLSDLDLAAGVGDGDFGAITAGVRRGVDRLGDLVDSFEHQVLGLAARHVRIFAQYADRGQVDLVVLPQEVPLAAAARVVLYDPAGRHAAAAPQPPPVTPEQVREWAFQGWCALIDLGKYLRRQSAWEALSRLHEARGWLWQLSAAADGVTDPQYGLTSILDFAPRAIPAGMEATVADLDPARLLSAARQLAALPAAAARRLPPDQQAVLPDAMARFVIADLAALADVTARPARQAGAGRDAAPRSGP